MKSFFSFMNSQNSNTLVYDRLESHQPLNQNKKNSESEVVEQIKRLKSQAATKDRFLQVIAHDLRKPFNVLLGISKLLKRNLHTYDKHKIEEMLDLNHQTILKTYNLLEDLLIWANSQTGNQNFIPKKIHLSKLLEQTIDLYQHSANEKGISISFNCNSNIELLADEFMIKAVMRNLLCNAIKFTHNGGNIEIKTTQTNDSVVVSFCDNGVGIDKKYQSEIWDSSSTFSTPGTADEQGSGLGLILCKEFVEKHGGTIWVESELGKGSTFSVMLPH